MNLRLHINTSNNLLEITEKEIDNYVRCKTETFQTLHVRNDIKRFECLECSAAFGRTDDLRRHISVVHEVISDHEYPHCSKAFG